MPAFRDIPGLPELWELTRGDPRIRIALLDGPAVLEHPCFVGARISHVEVHWDPREEGERYEDFVMHGTHIASEIVGQWGTSVEGIAPEVTILNIPCGWGLSTASSPLILSQAFDLALDLGVDIIHCAVCHPTVTAQSNPVFAKVFERVRESGVLVVAPTGNDGGDNECIPAVLPGTLAVGGLDDRGYPRSTSNFGGHHESGIMTYGENIHGAAPDGGTQIQKGTSVAAPIITAVAALLGSLQLAEGRPFDGQAIKAALLDTALPCPADSEQERCLSGVLNISGAVRKLFGPRPGAVVPEPEILAVEAAGIEAAPAVIIPGRPRLAYALGSLGYEFPSDAVEDSFREGMHEPENRALMAAYLTLNPDQARRLLWTLELEEAPIYVLRPRGSFAEETYGVLVAMLSGQTHPAEPLERVSIPGFVLPQTVTLSGGEPLPVLQPFSPRGMYGWSTHHLVEAALAGWAESQRDPARPALTSFLNKVYFELSNLGLAAPDRALNFVATNAFQAAEALVRAVSDGYELDHLKVIKSPYGRVDGDCWDVLMRFLDPENDHRADRLFRLTVDVADVMPVTLGKVQTWTLPREPRE